MRMPHSSEERRFTKAYDLYADSIFRHCYFRIGDRERGKELMQDAFLKTWEYIAKGNEVEDMRAFLYRTANNLIVDQYRRRAKRTEESFEDLQERGFDFASSERTEKETEEGFTSDEVASVLGKIEEPYRSAVIMRYIDDLSPKQIAQSLGESVNVVSVRINRGMKKLKSLLPVT